MKRIIQMYLSCMLVLAACALSYAQETTPAQAQIDALSYNDVHVCRCFQR